MPMAAARHLLTLDRQARRLADMRATGAAFWIAALTAISFVPAPAAAITIHVGSFYFHVPYVRHHFHRHRAHTGGNHGTVSHGIGRTEPTKGETASFENCTGLVPGVTNLPIDQIRRAIHPTADQETAFADLSAASSQASDVIKSSCPSMVPATSVSRLDAMQQRLGAAIKAAQLIRPPLVKLYEALSEEQRRQFDAMSARSDDNMVTPCRQQAGSFIDLPVHRIQEVLEPTPQQQNALDDLKNATQRAADQLSSSCRTGLPRSPVARLEMVKARLEAVADAMKTVRPALESFYASLNDEQKARFNIVGPR